MSVEAARSAATVPRAQAALGTGTPPAHIHAWARMQFELVDGHPVVRQDCDTCGLVRRYRAWERFWSPDTLQPEPGR